MAIKTFKFNYDNHEASATFKVDTSIFTDEHARATLEFFLWNYDEENDPITEVMKKYAMEAIWMSTKYSYNLNGVISDFNNKEGFVKVDGSVGVTLLSVESYNFDEDKLDYTVS